MPDRRHADRVTRYHDTPSKAETAEHYEDVAYGVTRSPFRLLLSGCTCGEIGASGAHRRGCLWAGR